MKESVINESIYISKGKNLMYIFFHFNTGEILVAVGNLIINKNGTLIYVSNISRKFVNDRFLKLRKSINLVSFLTYNTVSGCLT